MRLWNEHPNLDMDSQEKQVCVGKHIIFSIRDTVGPVNPPPASVCSVVFGSHFLFLP